MLVFAAADLAYVSVRSLAGRHTETSVESETKWNLIWQALVT